MASFSFDVVSEIDKSALYNSVDSARRELSQRYDFKNTPASLDWQNEKQELKIDGNDQWQVDAIIDILRKKLAGNGLDQKVIDTSQAPTQSGFILHKVLRLVEGLDSQKAKQISKLIKDNFPKLKTSTQGDSVRISGPSKNDLQLAIELIKKQDFNFPLNFTNYR